jgi:hypothetical protein
MNNTTYLAGLLVFATGLFSAPSWAEICLTPEQTQTESPYEAAVAVQQEQIAHHRALAKYEREAVYVFRKNGKWDLVKRHIALVVKEDALTKKYERNMPVNAAKAKP